MGQIIVRALVGGLTWTSPRYLVVALAGLGLLMVACQESEVVSAPAKGTELPSATSSPQTGVAQESVANSPPTTIASTEQLPLPTEQPTNTKIVAPPTSTPVYTALEVITETSTSPDGVWIAELTVAYPTGSQLPDYYQSLTVRRLDGSVTWMLIDSWSLWAPGATSPRIIGWLPGVFYFSDHGTADGCDPFGADPNIRRLTLDDGGLTETPILAGSSISLSPNAPLVAYVNRDSDMPEIVIRDLVTDALGSVAL